MHIVKNTIKSLFDHHLTSGKAIVGDVDCIAHYIIGILNNIKKHHCTFIMVAFA